MSTAAERLTTIWETPRTLYGELATVDHKKIGVRYLITAFVFLLLGGIEAAIMRMQLARPESSLVSPEAYNQLFTMHGTTMIFWYAQPILSGFGNYILPLMLGARDMAFPRLNAFSYWVFLFSGVLLYASFFIGQAPDGGWFAYTPLTGPGQSPGLNIDFYALALIFLTISTTAGAINFLATIFKLRAPGMSMQRLPLFAWSTLTTSFSIVFALPALTAACLFLELDRRYGTHFYDPVAGGSPILWQHLFWVFGHPWVYIVILPGTGIASMIIPTFCRRPLVGYPYVALATVSTGIAGFGVWAHHMFASGLPHLSATFFSGASFLVSIPSGVQIFAWLATFWAARRIILKTPMLFIIGFIILFVIGGVSGVMTASVPFDWQLTDSYFVVAHLHYVLIGINLFPVIAAFYYWLPKITGRMLSERLGTWNFWVMFIGFNLGFFPMHISGLLGMPRRVYTYPAGLGWDGLNLITTIGSYVFAIGILLFLINVVWSLRAGRAAGSNPWEASTLEWSMESPPPAYGSEHVPTVTSRDPLWDPHDEEHDPREERVLDDRREVLTTSILDAEPEHVVRMPEDSLYPLLLALAFTVLFTALLVKSFPMIIIGTIASLLSASGWLWPKPGEFPPDESAREGA